MLGTPLELCCTNPVTGYNRNGLCEAAEEDSAIHTVCVIITMDFLSQQRRVGNDLISMDSFSMFPGLKPGDRWCICARRWKQAIDAGLSPKIVLEATHEKTLKVLNMTLVSVSQID